MQPAAREDSYADLLPRVVALVRVVGHQDVDASVVAFVVVAAGAPVLPFTRLFAAPLLPHVLRVIEALGSRAIGLEGKVLFRF